MEKYIRKGEEQGKKDLENIINSNNENDPDIKRLRELAEDLKKKGMKDLYYKLINDILRKMRTIQEKIQNKLRNEIEDISGALEDFKILFKYKECASEYTRESENIYQTVNTTISSSFISNLEKFANLIKITTDGQVKLAEKACANILIFYRFSHTFEGKEQRLLSEDLSEKGKKEFEKIQKNFEKNFESFRSAVNELNLTELTKTLVNSQKWNQILQEIKKVCLSLNFLHEFDSIPDFEIISKELKEKIIDLSNSIKNRKLITENKIKIEELYKDLMSSIIKLKEVNVKFKDILCLQIDLDDLERETLAALVKNVEKIKTSISKELSKLNESISQADCDNFCDYFQHMEIFSKCISPDIIDVKDALENAENKIFEKIDKITKEIMQNLKNPRSVAEKIVNVAFFADNIYIFQKKINEMIDVIIAKYREVYGQAGIATLSMQLEVIPNGSRIISEHSALAGED